MKIEKYNMDKLRNKESIKVDLTEIANSQRSEKAKSQFNRIKKYKRRGDKPDLKPELHCGQGIMNPVCTLIINSLNKVLPNAKIEAGKTNVKIKNVEIKTDDIYNKIKESDNIIVKKIGKFLEGKNIVIQANGILDWTKNTQASLEFKSSAFKGLLAMVSDSKSKKMSFVTGVKIEWDTAKKLLKNLLPSDDENSKKEENKLQNPINCYDLKDITLGLGIGKYDLTKSSDLLGEFKGVKVLHKNKSEGLMFALEAAAERSISEEKTKTFLGALMMRILPKKLKLRVRADINDIEIQLVIEEITLVKDKNNNNNKIVVLKEGGLSFFFPYTKPLPKITLHATIELKIKAKNAVKDPVIKEEKEKELTAEEEEALFLPDQNQVKNEQNEKEQEEKDIKNEKEVEVAESESVKVDKKYQIILFKPKLVIETIKAKIEIEQVGIFQNAFGFKRLHIGDLKAGIDITYEGVPSAFNFQGTLAIGLDCFAIQNEKNEDGSDNKEAHLAKFVGEGRCIKFSGKFSIDTIDIKNNAFFVNFEKLDLQTIANAFFAKSVEEQIKVPKILNNIIAFNKGGTASFAFKAHRLGATAIKQGLQLKTTIKSFEQEVDMEVGVDFSKFPVNLVLNLDFKKEINILGLIKIGRLSDEELTAMNKTSGKTIEDSKDRTGPKVALKWTGTQADVDINVKLSVLGLTVGGRFVLNKNTIELYLKGSLFGMIESYIHILVQKDEQNLRAYVEAELKIDILGFSERLAEKIGQKMESLREKGQKLKEKKAKAKEEYNKIKAENKAKGKSISKKQAKLYMKNKLLNFRKKVINSGQKGLLNMASKLNKKISDGLKKLSEFFSIGRIYFSFDLDRSSLNKYVTLSGDDQNPVITPKKGVLNIEVTVETVFLGEEQSFRIKWQLGGTNEEKIKAEENAAKELEEKLESGKIIEEEEINDQNIENAANIFNQ